MKTGSNSELGIWSMVFIIYLFKMLIYLNRERDRERAGEGQRQREAEPEAGFRLRTVSTEPDTGLELTNREITT